MKPFSAFTAALLSLAFTASDSSARGFAGGGSKGGKPSISGRPGPSAGKASAGKMSASRPSAGKASASRNPATGSKMQRPVSRPSPQPATRPQARPQARPDVRPQARPAERPQARPETKPMPRPQTRPSVERPTTRPGLTKPDKRPDINRPGDKPGINRPETLPGNIRPGDKPGFNRPETLPGNIRPGDKPGINRPGGNDGPFGNRPGNNDGPLANRPDKNRPTTLPGMITYPNRPGKDKPNWPNVGGNNGNNINIGGRGDDNIKIGGGDRNRVHIDNLNVGRRNVGLNRPATLPARAPNWDTGRWGGRNSVWGNNVNIGNNVNVNINNNFRHSNNYSYRPNYWGARPWWGAGHCHTWHHGHWGYGYNHNHYHNHWYYDNDNDFAEGFMWGIAAWSLGNTVFNMGYQTYTNPYPAPPVQNTTVVYTQPLSVTAAKVPPGDDATATTAETKSAEALERSRNAFRSGDYVTAMSSVDESISYMPGDVTLHEYRALVLFSLNRFPEAAGVLNPVLASGPGWGWETMVGFYNSSSTYTNQLRRLEAYVKGKPDAADGHFLLGYHYMVSAHMEEAYKEFALTAELQPADTIARQLRDLTASSLPDGGSVEDVPPPPRPDPVPAEKLTGTWVCERGDNGKVIFVMTADGNYTWSYMNGDQNSELKGTYGLNDKGLLVLSGEDTQMVSEVSLSSDTAMRFVLVGAPDGDPGLEFKKN